MKFFLAVVFLASSAKAKKGGIDIEALSIDPGYNVQCQPGEITKSDGCVPPPPTTPQCPEACPPSQGCVDEIQTFYIRDLRSTYVPVKYCGVEYYEECDPKRTVYEFEDIIEVEEESTCNVKCEPVVVHRCVPEFKTKKVLKPNNTYTDVKVKQCIPVWVKHPCPSDPDKVCPKYECSGQYEEVINRVKTTTYYEEDEEEEFTKCVEVKDAENCYPETGTIKYNKVVGRKTRDIPEKCWEKFRYKECEDEHILKTVVIKVEVKVPKCRVGGHWGKPYYFDSCESFTCRPTTEEAYLDYIKNLD